MKIEKEAFFKKLTWNDVENWAGGTIAGRGRDYQRRGKVKDLALTPEGGLIARVQGTARYTTLVELADEQLTGHCTCPYGSDCKHAVAVVLDYLEKLKKKIPVSTVDENDQRLLLLGEDQGGLSDDGDEGPDDSYDEDNEEEEEGEAEETETGAAGFSAPESEAVLSHSGLHAYLAEQDKDRLISLLETLADSYPEAAAFLTDQSRLSSGKINRLVAATRKEIEHLSSDSGWSNHWDDEGYTPDYSGVRQRLEMLLSAGHADAVLGLGKKLLEAGINQVESSDDEGETCEEIASCLDIVFQALSQSTLSPSAQMLWAVEAELADEYELTAGSEAFWELEHRPVDWSTLADTLLKRLPEQAPGHSDAEFTPSYERDALTDWIIEALEEAGRPDEILPLCRREALLTGSYVRLVNRLLHEGRQDEAEQEIRRGVKVTLKSQSGTASRLKDILLKVRTDRGDWPTAAALRADAFFVRPVLETYLELQKAAEKAGVWLEVRTAAMRYLETGRLPAAPSWPLPDTGLREKIDAAQDSFPRENTLLDIAMAEKKPAEVVRWYDYSPENKKAWPWMSGSRENTVANAIAGTYPERAAALWKKLAEGYIAQTNVGAYEEAGRYLASLRRLWLNLGKQAEWQSYKAGLRSANLRKRRFLEVLERLEQKPIVEMP